LNPARDGSVLPILHLNGFKIANPTVLARISHEELTELLHSSNIKRDRKAGQVSKLGRRIKWIVPRPHADVRYLPLPWDLSSFRIFPRL
jgi:hypothetical protein